jgi:hypothetical protein
LVRPFALGWKDDWVDVRDQVGESLFVLVSGAAIGPPSMNTRRSVSKLSFGVHPLDPQSDAQTSGCEVESGAHVSYGSIVAVSNNRQLNGVWGVRLGGALGAGAAGAEGCA